MNEGNFEGFLEAAVREGMGLTWGGPGGPRTTTRNVALAMAKTVADPIEGGSEPPVATLDTGDLEFEDLVAKHATSRTRRDDAIDHVRDLVFADVAIVAWARKSEGARVQGGARPMLAWRLCPPAMEGAAGTRRADARHDEATPAGLQAFLGAVADVVAPHIEGAEGGRQSLAVVARTNQMAASCVLRTRWFDHADKLQWGGDESFPANRRKPMAGPALEVALAVQWVVAKIGPTREDEWHGLHDSRLVDNRSMTNTARCKDTVAEAPLAPASASTILEAACVLRRRRSVATARAYLESLGAPADVVEAMGPAPVEGTMEEVR